MEKTNESITEFKLSSSDRKFIIGGGILLGLIVGIAFPFVWGFVGQFEWIPFYRPFQFFMTAGAPWITVVLPVVTAAVGLCFAGVIIYTSPQITITDTQIKVRKGDNYRTIKRDQVAGIYREGSKIIIESAQGRQLFHGEIEGNKDKIAETFKAYGYPWESQ